MAIDLDECFHSKDYVLFDIRKQEIYLKQKFETLTFWEKNFFNHIYLHLETLNRTDCTKLQEY